jgi:uncharacterized membrane protein
MHRSTMLTRGVTGAVATAGVIAGVVIFEAALLPGLAIGAVAVLAPPFLLRRRGSKPTPGTAKVKQSRISLSGALPMRLGDLAHLRFSQAVVKTITFRMIVTSLDLTVNYVVLREPATAAGLSAISMVGGPLFYLVHEGTWNYLVGTGKLEVGSPSTPPNILNSRPLVKTVTYRTLASILEFTTNYAVVRDLETAALLSSFGIVLGPFVYYGHELAWERFAMKNGGAGPARTRRPNRREPVIIDVNPRLIGAS